MQYRVLPHTASDYVQSICVLTNEGETCVYGCIPNGAIGISVITAGKCDIKSNGGWEKQPHLFVYGLVRSLQWHRISTGYREVTIVFKPHYLQLFLKERIAQLPENRAVILYDLFKKDAVDELYEKLSAFHSDADIVEAVNFFLKRSVCRHSPDKRVAEAHRMILAGKTRRVEDISTALNVSPAGLRALFRDCAGISPKELIRIRRINEALRTREHNHRSLTGLAYHLEYFDQSHFIHDFKEAIGITPRQYFGNARLMAEFYTQSRWSEESFA